ncbi:AraC family transcriptional regulator [Cohnella pontilimi]|uniref:AraC family transcriptional regulator n=1 Tax=Cohnella pontilimi TaxID=2564100 RepID=A0A4V5LSE0_9BACL|nr:helix-turn-helix domain-containing protein [Cohnella pontilimi]TJY42699.1 AraC family transcriptional regulator [Cohnella pontilimi]
MNRKVGKSDKGILKADAAKQLFTLDRYEPSPDLSAYIEHYWIVRWDLRGREPYRQVILSYPNVNLAFEKERGGIFAGVYGVPISAYTRHLQDQGHVIAAKFKPGGFYPFWKQPVARLHGLTVPCGELFDSDLIESFGRDIFAAIDGQQMIELLETFLRQRNPEPDDNVNLLSRIVQTVIDDRDIAKVEDIVVRFGINKRSLQRLFNRYVGVTPKWVIQRFRLQEAAERLEKGEVSGWPELAVDLGYYDQAHFIKEFKAVIGQSPEEYMRELGN